MEGGISVHSSGLPTLPARMAERATMMRMLNMALLQGEGRGGEGHAQRLLSEWQTPVPLKCLQTAVEAECKHLLCTTSSAATLSTSELEFLSLCLCGCVCV